MIDFMRRFLSNVLKDNSSLERGILTGILRAAKEGIFSGLNNLRVFTLLDEEFSDKFGFTVARGGPSFDRNQSTAKVFEY